VVQPELARAHQSPPYRALGPERDTVRQTGEVDRTLTLGVEFGSMQHASSDTFEVWQLHLQVMTTPAHISTALDVRQLLCCCTSSAPATDFGGTGCKWHKMMLCFRKGCAPSPTLRGSTQWVTQ
jgi:hypothetical protein